MTEQKRTVFYLSDGTGITAETLGHSLLTQFDGIAWQTVNVPFLDDIEKAEIVSAQINHAAEHDGHRPLVFSTLLKPEILQVIKQANCRVYDFFETFNQLAKDNGINGIHFIATGNTGTIVYNNSLLNTVGTTTTIAFAFYNQRNNVCTWRSVCVLRILIV